jgi:signal transduction histidine kinase
MELQTTITEGRFEDEGLRVRKDGTLFWINAVITPLHDEAGNLRGFAKVSRDITERKQVENELRQTAAELARSNAELQQFVYAVSHDLKSPLRGVKYLASWIAEDAAAVLPEASKEHLNKMHSRIQRMEKMLDDLLIYSRVGRQYYNNKESFNSHILVEEVIDLLAPPAGFTIKIQEAMPMLTTYRVLLEMVFKNLIENAIKYHDRTEGQVEISAQEVDGFVEFSVTDDGPGIDEAFHERIFQIFQTLRPKDETGGSGLGLAIVKKAVEGQGGTISVISSEGQGATFRFTWPKGAH